MSSYSMREFRGEADVDAMVDFRMAIELQDPSGYRFSRERLRKGYLQARPGWNREISLWESADRLVGIGESIATAHPGDDPVAYLRCRIHPDESDSEMLGAMLYWGESAARTQLGPGFQVAVSEFTWAQRRIDLLESRGYSIERVFQYMKIRLDRLPRVPEELAGYRLRQLRGAAEVDAWLDLYNNAFQDHYGFHPIAREDRLHSLAANKYMPELDLVVASRDGELAAFCLTDRRVDDAGAAAWHVDLIGTHREHRRRGLAKWLLQSTMVLIEQAGGTEIVLEVDATSPTGANRLYQRLGFVVTRESIDYRKSFV